MVSLAREVVVKLENEEERHVLLAEIRRLNKQSEAKYANPAAVGLGAFGATTLLLQLHNLGFVGTNAVMWLAFIFGGLVQLMAGFYEFRTGNSFGFAAFTTYGAFWIALGGIWLNNQIGLAPVATADIGWFLVVFTFLTAIYFVGSLRQNSALAWIFLTLLIGFIFLDVGHLVSGAEIFNQIAAIELIVCSGVAWYLMAHVILSPFKINIPAGQAWIK